MMEQSTTATEGKVGSLQMPGLYHGLFSKHPLHLLPQKASHFTPFCCLNHCKYPCTASIRDLLLGKTQVCPQTELRAHSLLLAAGTGPRQQHQHALTPRGALLYCSVCHKAEGLRPQPQGSPCSAAGGFEGHQCIPPPLCADSQSQTSKLTLCHGIKAASRALRRDPQPTPGPARSQGQRTAHPYSPTPTRTQRALPRPVPTAHRTPPARRDSPDPLTLTSAPPSPAPRRSLWFLPYFRFRRLPALTRRTGSGKRRRP